MAGGFIKKFVDFLLFSSLFISFCAVMMVHQANELLLLNYPISHYLYFVFFSTVCSYNLHWYYTSGGNAEEQRMQWTHQHRLWHLFLFVAGGLAAAYFFILLRQHWYWLSIAVGLTFLYTAPKLPFFFAPFLRKIAIGKTIYLTLVWTYVTTVLPIILSGKSWQASDILLCLSRFFMIYCLDIIFDYRDRENDRAEGIRSMITLFSNKGIDRLYFGSLVLFLGFTALLATSGFSFPIVASLLLPGIVLGLIYKTSKSNFSDYLYYFVLDGLMLLSPLITAVLPI